MNGLLGMLVRVQDIHDTAIKNGESTNRFSFNIYLIPISALKRKGLAYLNSDPSLSQASPPTLAHSCGEPLEKYTDCCVSTIINHSQHHNSRARHVGFSARQQGPPCVPV